MSWVVMEMAIHRIGIVVLDLFLNPLFILIWRLPPPLRIGSFDVFDNAFNPWIDISRDNNFRDDPIEL